MLESKIQKEILAYLRKNKIFHIRFQAQTNINGIPDIICCYKGLFIGLELKQEKGKATDLQNKKLEAINNSGGIGLIIKSLKEVETLFGIIDVYDMCHIPVEVAQIRYEMRNLYERDKETKE